MEGSQLHNYLTCSITFLAAILPHSLEKKPLQELGHKKKLPNYAAFQRAYS